MIVITLADYKCEAMDLQQAIKNGEYNSEAQLKVMQHALVCIKVQIGHIINEYYKQKRGEQ